VHVNGGAGNDEIRVSGDGVALMELLRANSLFEGGGGSDALHVADGALRVGKHYEFGAGTLRRTDIPGRLEYHGFAHVHMQGGSGNDVFDLDRTDPGTIVHITAGRGDDTINISPRTGRLESVGGIDVHGGEGTDVIHFVDRAQEVGHSYRIGREFDRTNLPYTAYFGSVERVEVIAGAGNDVLDGSTCLNGVSLGLFGGAGDDSLIGGPGDDTLVGGPGADRMVGGGGRDTALDFNPDEGDTAEGVEVFSRRAAAEPSGLETAVLFPARRPVNGIGYYPPAGGPFGPRPPGPAPEDACRARRWTCCWTRSCETLGLARCSWTSARPPILHACGGRSPVTACTSGSTRTCASCTIPWGDSSTAPWC
jgi:Ca2+-binding RTX toxin-like protein